MKLETLPSTTGKLLYIRCRPAHMERAAVQPTRHWAFAAD